MIKMLFKEFEQQNYISSMMKGEGICKITIDDYEVSIPFGIAIMILFLRHEAKPRMFSPD